MMKEELSLMLYKTDHEKEGFLFNDTQIKVNVLSDKHYSSRIWLNNNIPTGHSYIIG